MEETKKKGKWDQQSLKTAMDKILSKEMREKTTCVVCLEDHDEDWIQCSSCQEWAHEACADVPECGDTYICDRCTMF